jgi:hypothetical protein
MERLRRELLIKFRRGELSYGKALELQALLEEQRRRHEEAGNIAAPFLVSIILLLLPAFLASLATSEGEKVVKNRTYQRYIGKNRKRL